jgi:hypothetical protein
MKAEGLGLPGSGRPIRDGAHAAHGGILTDRRRHCILSQLLRDQPGSIRGPAPTGKTKSGHRQWELEPGTHAGRPARLRVTVSAATRRNGPLAWGR